MINIQFCERASLGAGRPFSTFQRTHVEPHIYWSRELEIILVSLTVTCSFLHCDIRHKGIILIILAQNMLTVNN
jgi:hypothetical protein